MSVCLPACLPAWLPAWLSLSVCLSVCLGVWLSLSLSLSVCLSVSFCLSLSLSLCLSLSVSLSLSVTLIDIHRHLETYRLTETYRDIQRHTGIDGDRRRQAETDRDSQRWIDGWIHACMHAYVHACMPACLHGLMHACTHVRIYGCLYVCMCVWTIWKDVKLLSSAAIWCVNLLSWSFLVVSNAGLFKYWNNVLQGATAPFISPWPTKLLMFGEDMQSDQLHVPASFPFPKWQPAKPRTGKSIGFSFVSAQLPQSAYFIFSRLTSCIRTRIFRHGRRKISPLRFLTSNLPTMPVSFNWVVCAREMHSISVIR